MTDECQFLIKSYQMSFFSKEVDDIKSSETATHSAGEATVSESFVRLYLSLKSLKPFLICLVLQVTFALIDY